jgi:hypothetical protein
VKLVCLNPYIGAGERKPIFNVGWTKITAGTADVKTHHRISLRIRTTPQNYEADGQDRNGEFVSSNHLDLPALSINMNK